MLTELRISNFAVLEQLDLRIDAGFTVLTGETGAGKSLLIDAIKLLIGGRASSDQIRFGEDEAHLEAAFVNHAHFPPVHQGALVIGIKTADVHTAFRVHSPRRKRRQAKRWKTFVIKFMAGKTGLVRK